MMKYKSLNLCSLQENSAFLLNALAKRSLSDEQPTPDLVQLATVTPDNFRSDAMTPEPEDLKTLAPNSAAPSPLLPYSLAPEAQNLQSIIGPGDTLEEELQAKLSELISRANSKDGSTSEDENKMQTVDQEAAKESEMIKEQIEREKQRTNDRLKDCFVSEETGKMNGQEKRKSERLTSKSSIREEGRIREKNSGVLDKTADEQERRGGHKREPNRHSKRQHKRDFERDSEQKRGVRRSGSCASSPALTPSSQEGVLSDNQVWKQDETRAAGCGHCLCLSTWLDWNNSSYLSSSLYPCANHVLFFHLSCN